ncbi:MAG: hypothetical protein H0X67_12260 [Acidobacteria bacterium]|nr:hypothetical protein [Acidobacteriota bacterium]
MALATGAETLTRWGIAHLSSTRFAAAVAVCVSSVACGGSPAQPAAFGDGTTQNSPASLTTFKVATWNIRSGMGIRGFTTTSWSSDTLNCTDASKPLNAWGMGLPQAELARIRDDRSIVAFAVQEAWNCGNPSNVNSVLGFQTISRELNGTALAARYGFASPPTYTRISGQDWLVGGAVCLDPSCSASMPMFSAHWTPPSNAFGAVAQATLDALGSQPTPHILLGDLNVYRVDQWNPDVPCTGPDVPGRVDAIQRVEAAGYQDAWKATQASEGWTGMASRAGCGAPHGNLFKRIDYVYTKGLRAVSTTRLARAPAGGDSPSDHVILIAEVTTSGARAAPGSH